MPKPPNSDGVVDVEQLMNTLRRRVEEKKAAGLYRVDELVVQSLEDDEPWNSRRLEELLDQAMVSQRMVSPRSTRPVVGSLIETLKRFVIKAGWYNLNDVTEQVTSFNAGMVSYSGSLAAEVTRLGRELERLRSDTGSASLADLEARVKALEVAALEERVARLERRLEGEPPEVPPLRASGEPFDELRLDAWLEHQPDQGLPEAVRGKERPLHLQCGVGEIIDEVGGVGVDSRGDIVATAREASREVIHADPVGYVNSTRHGTYDAITVDGLVEELEPEALAALVQGIGNALSSGGVVAVSVRNPLSENERRDFWRDPRRRRPVDPRSIAFLLECEGLSGGELRWGDVDDEGAPRSCVVVAER